MHAFPSATRTHYFCRILARCPCNTDNTKCSYVDPRDQGAKTCTAKQACLPQSRRPVQQTLILAHNTNDSCVLDRRDFELFMKTASHCGRFGHPAHTSSSRTQYEHTQLDILFYTDKPSIHSTSMLVPANLKQGLHFSVWRSNVFLQLTTCALVLKLFRIEQFVPRRVCCYRTVMHSRKLKLSCKQKSNKPPGGTRKGEKGEGAIWGYNYTCGTISSTLQSEKQKLLSFFLHISAKAIQILKLNSTQTQCDPTFSFLTSFTSSFNTGTCMSVTACVKIPVRLLTSPKSADKAKQKFAQCTRGETLPQEGWQKLCTLVLGRMDGWRREWKKEKRMKRALSSRNTAHTSVKIKPQKGSSKSGCLVITIEGCRNWT